MSFKDRVKVWSDLLFKPKPKPEPEPDRPEPAVKPGRAEKPVSLLYLAWKLWRQKVDAPTMMPLLLAAPFLLFLAASGLLAWVAVLLSFFARVLRMVMS